MASPRRVAEAARVRPHPRQFAWQRLEFTAFVHFGMNTMTDREWGTGCEDPALFSPDLLDADQWARTAVAAGMRGLILTAKHHDGFCLWPSETTAHSVAASPWRGGRGDLVREVAEACARHGLRFGVYLSPWDRHDPRYGSGDAYDDCFVAQLTELLTGYGPIFSVWLDGANGEGPDGRVQRYDWQRYHRTVREHQPEAVIAVCGPDVRWCGNEAGATRADEWSVVPASLRDAERIASRSQRADEPASARQVRSDEADLGSRAAIDGDDQPLVWYPAEVNTSIRPGWFHHPAEDGQVLSGAELFGLWQRSVGGNAVLLVNVPPDRHGRLADADVAALGDVGERIRRFWDADVSGTAVREAAEAQEVAVGGPQRLRWDRPQLLDALVLEEDLAHGQQIDDLRVLATVDGEEAVEVARLRSVGHRRIVRLPEGRYRSVAVEIRAARGEPHLLPMRAIARPGSSVSGRIDE